MMEYQGYFGKVEFDDEAGICHSEVLNTREVIPGTKRRRTENRLGVPRLRRQHQSKPVSDLLVLDSHLVENRKHLPVETRFRELAEACRKSAE